MLHAREVAIGVVIFKLQKMFDNAEKAEDLRRVVIFCEINNDIYRDISLNRHVHATSLNLSGRLSRRARRLRLENRLIGERSSRYAARGR